jgi:hypothetical protein
MDQKDIQELEDKLKSAESPEHFSLMLSMMMMAASG